MQGYGVSLLEHVLFEHESLEHATMETSSSISTICIFGYTNFSFIFLSPESLSGHYLFLNLHHYAIYDNKSQTPLFVGFPSNIFYMPDYYFSFCKNNCIFAYTKGSSTISSAFFLLTSSNTSNHSLCFESISRIRMQYVLFIPSFK